MAYGFFRYDVQGLDKKGNPIYKADKITVMDKPNGMKDVARVWYDTDTDTLVAAEQGVEENGRSDMRRIGRIFVCKDYLKGNRDPIHFTSGAGSQAQCIAVAGDYVFTGGWFKRRRSSSTDFPTASLPAPSTPDPRSGAWRAPGGWTS